MANYSLRKIINMVKHIFASYEVTAKIGYHYATGFIHINDSANGFVEVDSPRYIYFSIPDERHSTDIHKKVMFRTAKNEHDFTGGRNHFFDLETATEDQIVRSLYRRQSQ